MANITHEIRECLRITGKPQRALAIVSGIPAPTICNLLKGKQADVLATTQDALRRGINQLLMEHQKQQQVNADNNLTTEKEAVNV